MLNLIQTILLAMQLGMIKMETDSESVQTMLLPAQLDITKMKADRTSSNYTFAHTTRISYPPTR